MTPNDTAAARRHSTAVVILAGLAGLIIGAIAVFAVTGLGGRSGSSCRRRPIRRR